MNSIYIYISCAEANLSTEGVRSVGLAFGFCICWYNHP